METRGAMLTTHKTQLFLLLVLLLSALAPLLSFFPSRVWAPTEFEETLNVNVFDSTYNTWNVSGDTPYLDAEEYPVILCETHYNHSIYWWNVENSSTNYMGYFEFENASASHEWAIDSATLNVRIVECREYEEPWTFRVQILTQDGYYVVIDEDDVPFGYTWYNVEFDVSGWFSNFSDIDDLELLVRRWGEFEESMSPCIDYIGLDVEWTQTDYSSVTIEDLNVNNHTMVDTTHVRTGDNPYLNATDHPTHFIYWGGGVAGGEDHEGRFQFDNLSASINEDWEITSCNLTVRFKQGVESNHNLMHYKLVGPAGSGGTHHLNVSNIPVWDTWYNVEFDIMSWTWNQEVLDVNNMTFKFIRVGGDSTAQQGFFDHAWLDITYVSEDVESEEEEAPDPLGDIIVMMPILGGIGLFMITAGPTYFALQIKRGNYENAFGYGFLMVIVGIGLVAVWILDRVSI